MKLASQLINGEMELNETEINVIVFENKELFRKICLAFEEDTIDDMVVFSDNNTPFEFLKRGCFVSNPVNIGFESKKLNNKIYSYLAELSETESQSCLLSAKAKLIEFAKSLATNCEFEIDYNPEIDVSGLLKLLAFKVNKEGLSSAEQLIMYLKLVARYLKTDLFFIQNLHLFYSKEEIEGIYDDILLNQLNLVILENYQEKYVLMNEKYLIVDNDLCIIDN